MKKTSIQTAILAVVNLFLLATFIVACQKETPLPVQKIHNLQLQYDSTTGVRYVLSEKGETKAATAEDRDGIEGFPWSDGNCRVIFKVRDFDPTMIDGGDGPPCSSSIFFRGYSKPNGQGTVLFSISVVVTGDWQEIIIPSSAYIGFVIQNNELLGNLPCRFKFSLADYGWNINFFTWINIPYNLWLPVITGRYAPKDHTNASGGYTWYDEYLCDEWCTWTVPVYFDNQNPPPLDASITGKLLCYYGQNALIPSGQPADSRIIKSYLLTDNHDRTLYFYPISREAQEYYRTEAYDFGTPDPLDVITYDVFGPDHHGAGSFSFWQVADYPLMTTGKKCNVVRGD